MARKPKRIIVLADLHCGHVVGLTHPDFDQRPNNTASPEYDLYMARAFYWKWYADKVKELSPVAALIVNGDCVDGKGERSGGTELLTTDRSKQVEMAIAALEVWKAPRVFMSYGTPYHTGVTEDWERDIAKSKQLKVASIGGHDWLDVNGLVFDYKHSIGSSSIPHGRFTALARERLWNILWNEHGEYPKSDVIIRSHVHYSVYCGEDWLALTTPALQAPGTKFGSRQCSGTVHFGLVHFDVVDEESWTWKRHIVRRRRQQVAAAKL